MWVIGYEPQDEGMWIADNFSSLDKAWLEHPKGVSQNWVEGASHSKKLTLKLGERHTEKVRSIQKDPMFTTISYNESGTVVKS